jgi:hypothetical protein
MPNYRVEVANFNTGALPADYNVNVLYVTTDSIPSDAAWQTCLTSIIAAYTADVELAFSNFLLKVYNMADPTPRPIIATKQTLGGASVAGPHEVALCLSYYSGRNLPRTRGRIYLGPFQGSIVAVATPNAVTISDLITLGTSIHAAFAALGGSWAIHSVKDNTFLPITNTWVDNAWDTQRRRGMKATSRTLHAF